MYKNQIILKCQGRDQTHKNKHENHLRSHNFFRDFWLAAKYSLKKYASEGCFPFYIRGPVLRHVTSQHYVFCNCYLTQINDGHGQGQRSRSKVKVSQNQYKSEIPYYPFITLQNRRFLQSILVTAVCYFAKS